MIVIGVDGSLTCTGLAVIDTDGVPGTEKILSVGEHKTSPKDGTDMERYEAIADGILAVAQTYNGELVGLELPYVDRKKSPEVALRLRELKAIVEHTLTRAGYPVVGVNVSQRSAALGVAGKTKRKPLKDLVVQAVSTRYGLNVTHDQADAIGVGLAAVKLHRRGERPEQLRMKLPGGRARRRNVKQPGGAS